MTQKHMTCIVCPLGCSLEVRLEEGSIKEIRGNSCKRGAEYAEAECLNPVRTLTSTVRVGEGSKPLVSVKSNSPLPKGLLFKCMETLRTCTVMAPVEIGQVVVSNIRNTGIDIVATSKVISAAKSVHE